MPSLRLIALAIFAALACLLVAHTEAQAQCRGGRCAPRLQARWSFEDNTEPNLPRDFSRESCCCDDCPNCDCPDCDCKTSRGSQCERGNGPFRKLAKARPLRRAAGLAVRPVKAAGKALRLPFRAVGRLFGRR